MQLTEGGPARGCVAPAGGRAGLGGRRDPPTRPSAPPWQLLLEPRGRSGPENMAVDVALLERADRMGEAFLRLYRFDPACLSLGRNEAAGGYDRAAIARRGVDVVRRPTGGAAVWHEHELTYAVAAPIATFGGLRRAYQAIHARLGTVLGTLGRGRTPRPRAEARRLRAGAPGWRVPATRIDPARRVAGNHHGRKPQASSRKCGNHAFGGVGSSNHVGRGRRRHRSGVGHRHNLPQPPPTSTNLHHLVFRPRLDLAPLTSPWNLRAPCRPSDRRPG